MPENKEINRKKEIISEPSEEKDIGKRREALIDSVPPTISKLAGEIETIKSVRDQLDNEKDPVVKEALEKSLKEFMNELEATIKNATKEEIEAAEKFIEETKK